LEAVDLKAVKADDRHVKRFILNIVSLPGRWLQ